MRLVQIPEERYIELLEKEKRNKNKETKRILELLYLMRSREINLNKLILGFEGELR